MQSLLEFAYITDPLLIAAALFLSFVLGVAEAKCILATAVCVSACLSVCVSVVCRIPTLLHGPGCNLGGMVGVTSSCALFGGFTIGAQVSLL